MDISLGKMAQTYYQKKATQYILRPSRKKIILYTLGLFIPAMFIFTLFHEFGHILVALIFGFDIKTIHIVFFPFEIGDSYVTILTPFNTPEWQHILLYISGSLMTLFMGLLFFWLFYRHQLDFRLEILCSLYSVIFCLDFIVYNIMSVFFEKSGDWFWIYRTAPYLNGIFLIIGIALISAFFFNIRKITIAIDVD